MFTEWNFFSFASRIRKQEVKLPYLLCTLERQFDFLLWWWSWHSPHDILNAHITQKKQRTVVKHHNSTVNQKWTDFNKISWTFAPLKVHSCAVFTSSWVLMLSFVCKCDLSVDVPLKKLICSSSQYFLILFLDIKQRNLCFLDLAFKTPLRPIQRQERVLTEMDVSSPLNSTARNIYSPIMRFLTPSKESESIHVTVVTVDCVLLILRFFFS